MPCAHDRVRDRAGSTVGVSFESRPAAHRADVQRDSVAMPANSKAIIADGDLISRLDRDQELGKGREELVFKDLRGGVPLDAVGSIRNDDCRPKSPIVGPWHRYGVGRYRHAAQCEHVVDRKQRRYEHVVGKCWAKPALA
jgi:hypothetical protein